MAHSSTFDTLKFIEILRSEVKDIAEKRYGGNSKLALGKAFQFWCIENITPGLTAGDVELARSRCEDGTPADEKIDGTWMDSEKKTFFLMQSKYSIPDGNVYSEDFRIETFGSQAAEELEQGFRRLINLADDNEATMPRKMLELTRLYREALTNKLRVELIVTASGTPRKALLEKVEEINSVLRKETRFSKHHCSTYDIEHLNQIYSDKWTKLPGPVYLSTVKALELENLDGTTYAVAATVMAKELVRIREECSYSIYHSNFRFMITGSRGVARPKIEATLADPAEKLNFWRYNNGITISCESVRAVNEAKDKFEIKGLQVVNGLQTIETLCDNKNRLTDEVQLLVRIIPTSTEAGEKSRRLEEHIAEYSNSQTPITPRDLRANDPVQQEIERIAWEKYDLKYVRKVGQRPGAPGRPTGGERIDNEDAAQAALSFWFGQSWEAKLKKKLLFELSTSAASGYYDKVFNDSTSTEYILFPALLWNFQYEFIDSISDKSRRGVYRGVDLLALSFFGEIFRDVNGLPIRPSKSDKVIKKLQPVIFYLKNLHLQDGEAEAKKCWKAIFEALYKVVEQRRKAEARARGVEVEDISPRNIYVNLRYTDPKLRKQAARLLNERALRRTVAQVFPHRP